MPFSSARCRMASAHSWICLAPLRKINTSPSCSERTISSNKTCTARATTVEELERVAGLYSSSTGKRWPSQWTVGQPSGQSSVARKRQKRPGSIEADMTTSLKAGMAGAALHCCKCLRSKAGSRSVSLFRSCASSIMMQSYRWIHAGPRATSRSSKPSVTNSTTVASLTFLQPAACGCPRAPMRNPTSCPTSV
eukprot:1338949-Rhodomonas_salina.1